MTAESRTLVAELGGAGRMMLECDLLFRMKQASFASRKEFDVVAWRDQVRVQVAGVGGVDGACGGTGSA